MAVKLAFVATFTAIVAAIRAAWNFYTIVVNYILVVQILHLFLMSVGPNVLKKTLTNTKTSTAPEFNKNRH